MSFAEIMLRIGLGVGGWLIYLGHMLTLAVIGEVDCDPASNEMWRGTIAFGVISGAAISSVGMGLRWRDSLRWLAAGSFIVTLLAFPTLLAGIRIGTIAGESLCHIAGATPQGVDLGAFPATRVEFFWPILQIAVAAIGVVQTIRYWRPGRSATREANSPAPSPGPPPAAPR